MWWIIYLLNSFCSMSLEEKLDVTNVDSVSLQAVRHDYYLITTPMTWVDAQTYCRSHFHDLAAVRTDNDWQTLNEEAAVQGLSTTGWVGLFINIKDWYWSYGIKLATVNFWASGQPDNNGGYQACAAITSLGQWDDFACTDLKYFICYNVASGLVAITINMSWWGGQTYCKTYHTDLASVNSATDNNNLQAIAQQQGTSWFGLFRDTWCWSDNSPAVQLRWTPGYPNNVDYNDNCGSVNNSKFMDKPCNNLYNVFCETPHTVKYKVVKLKLQGDNSVFNPTVQSAILQLIIQKLNGHGISRATNVTWRVQPDGNIFHKKSIGGL